MALQKHKGGDGPSKYEVHLQRCQESPREHMPHNRGISGHRRYPPKAHLDSLGCKILSDPNRSIVGSSSTYPYIHITINTLQVELKNAWGATDLRNMKCVCSSAGITNTCHTTEESQAIVVTPPKVHLDSLGCITVCEWGGP